MNKQVSTAIIVVSLVLAAGGITAGIKASNDKQALQAELDALRANLGKDIAAPEADGQEADAPVVAMTDMSLIDTNDVAVLLAELNARDAELARLRAQFGNRRDNQQNQARQSFQDRMAQMQEENPEAYQAMIDRRTELQDRVRDEQFQRLTAFSEVDTSKLTPEELANHTALVEKLSAMWELTGNVDPENPPDRDTMREALGNMRDIGRLMDQERTIMFKQLGSEVGLTGGEAEEFAGYVESIIETTSMNPASIMRGGRGGRGGR